MLAVKLPAHMALVALVVWIKAMDAIVEVVVKRLLLTKVARNRTVWPSVCAALVAWLELPMEAALAKFHAPVALTRLEA